MTTLAELLAAKRCPLPWRSSAKLPDCLIDNAGQVVGGATYMPIVNVILAAVNHADALAAALREYIAINAKHGYEFDSNEPKLFGQMTAALAAYDAALAEAKGATDGK